MDVLAVAEALKEGMRVQSFKANHCIGKHVSS